MKFGVFCKHEDNSVCFCKINEKCSLHKKQTQISAEGLQNSSEKLSGMNY